MSNDPNVENIETQLVAAEQQGIIPRAEPDGLVSREARETPARVEGERVEKEKAGRRGGKQGSWVAKLMGSAEKMLIYKRDEQKGTLALCSDYTQKDLERSGNVELFVRDYLVPTWGHGEYSVHTLGSDGIERDAGTVTVAVPKGVAQASGGGDPSALFSTVSQAAVKIAEEAERRARENAAAGNAQIEGLMKMMTLMGIKPGADGQMNPMMMMLMMQMLPKPQPDTSPSAVAALSEAFKTALAQAHVDRLPPMPPLMPPMMPPPEPGAGLAETVAALAQVMKPQGPSAVEALLQLAPHIAPMLAPKPQPEGFKIGDLLTMLPTLMPILKTLTGADQIDDLKAELRSMRDKNNGGLEGIVQNYKVLKEIAQDMAPGAPVSEGFFGLVRDIIQTLPDTTSAIGDLVAKINSVKTPDKIESPKNRKALPETGDDDEVVLEYPPGFDPYLEKIVNAKSDGDMVGETLRAFQFLARHKGWDQQLGGMLAMAKQGRVPQVLEFIANFFNGLHESGDCDEATAKRGIGAFQRNIDGVIAWAQGLGKKRVPPKTTPEATPAAAPAAAPAVTLVKPEQPEAPKAESEVAPEATKPS